LGIRAVDQRHRFGGLIAPLLFFTSVVTDFVIERDLCGGNVSHSVVNIPKYERPLDDKNRVVLPRDVTNKWGKEIVFRPNTYASIVHPKGVELEHVIRSVEILLEDLRHQLEVEKEE